ncbi:N-acetyltransferase [Cryobacterium algoritolerans]|uniref:N-acetyltransferase n=1 Tax=Cryobacterium algoritolerans TaxID=1259184 RepID=A0A4R8WMI3_9MICO|nr:GNAT family N-acetyltransferase [Cryobacterium algoritolerans]TFC09669.1 N-acetyltransferase [Cryobacterium algoritolerans]
MTTDSAATESSAPTVRHEPALARYTLRIDGETAGFADYEVDGTEVLFTHVEVDPARRGQRLASILVEQALDDVRVRTDLTVVPVCPYVVSWIELHAEYQDLLTRGR